MKKSKKIHKKIIPEKYNSIDFLKTTLIIVGIIFLVILIYLPTEELDYVETPIEEMQIPEGYELSSGWTITSYQVVDEKFYDGEKIEVFDKKGNSLGFYKKDFLKQLRIDGAGKVEDPEKSGKYLHYDYIINDGKTHYWADKSLGAYDNELIFFTGSRPSVAVNPPVPQGTQIKFINLGSDSGYNPNWVNEILRTKIFYADDKFYNFGKNEKKIDIYMGLQKSREFKAESLLMRNVTIALKYPD